MLVCVPRLANAVQSFLSQQLPEVIQVKNVEEAKNSRARQIVERLDLTPGELQRLVCVLRVVLDTLDDDYRANIAAIARELGKSRRTIYHWADRVLEATASELREIRVGRPSKRGRTGGV
jgi:hypothetical protein